MERLWAEVRKRGTGAEEGEDTEAGVVVEEEVVMVDTILTSMRSLRASKRSLLAPLTRQGEEEYFISPVAVGVQFPNRLLGCPGVVLSELLGDSPKRNLFSRRPHLTLNVSI